MRIYLDHAATSPVRPEVTEVIAPYFDDVDRMGNPSSLHALGRKAAETLAACHDLAANAYNCRHDDIVFNSGGSEGDTHVFVGIALLLKKKVHVAATAIEHKAVLNAAQRLEDLGHRKTIVPACSDGVVDLDFLEKLLDQNRPDLISVMAVNNETGVIQPVAEIARMCADREVLFHTDAVQAVGHGLVEILTDQEIPLMTISGHKFGGPRGTGVLIQRQQLISDILGYGDMVALPSLICGGSQEHGCRAGTENVAGVVGLIKALQLSEDPEQDEAGRLFSLKQRLEDGLRTIQPDCIIHGENVRRAQHITSVALPGYLGRELLKQLDRKGVCIGLGSACTGCSTKVSHVLEAMQVKPEIAEATLRFSLGWSNTEEDIANMLEVLRTILR